ncbi:MAG TPA: pitrilysin family protein, partial [Pirellulales bacterium]|nr:pitrilysin family protein [Pirellulales bacterium]
LSDWAAQGDWRLYFLYRDRLEQVTASDVKRVAGEYLHRNNRTVGMFVPSAKTEKTPIPETPDLATVLEGYQGRETVAAGEAFDVSPQNIEKHLKRSTLDDGIKLVMLPKKTRGQTVHLQVVLRYGNLENLKGLTAACELLPELMTRGTQQLSRQEIQDQLDRQFATLHARGDAGKAVFSIETKHANLPAVLELLRQILREPALAEDEFEILQRETLAQLEEQLTDPRSLALVRLRRTVSPYPKTDVRYIPTVEEDLARTKMLSLDQLRTLRDDYLGGETGEVAVVGDFDADECRQALTEIFSGWQSSQSYARLPRLYFDEVQHGEQRIETPDKANAVYMAGQAMPLNDNDPSYPALLIGNYVFGGSSLASRLGDRVRQNEGLSYGVVSHFAAESLDERASVTIMAIYNPQNAAKVVTAIGEELERLIADGITDKELQDAAKGFIDLQEVARTSDATLARVLADDAHIDRTMDYYATLESKIQSLSTDEVHSAIKAALDPERMTIVIAGDFKKAESE